MIDSVSFPPSASGPVSPLKPGAPTDSVITSIPRAVINLPPSTLLTGTVTAQNPNGTFTFTTSSGALTLASTLPLQKGNQLVMQIVVAGNQFTAKLLSVDGKPVPKVTVAGEPTAHPPGSNTPSTIAIEPDVFRLSSNTSRQLPQQQAGTAPLYQPAVITPASPEGKPALLNAVLVSPQPNGIDKFLNQPALFQQAPNSPNLFSTLATGVGAAHNPAPSSVVVQGSTLQLRITSATPPKSAATPASPTYSSSPTTSAPATSSASTGYPSTTAATSPPPGSANSVMLQGIVLGTEQSGEADIKTEIGIIKLQLDNTLPKGTDLELEVLSVLPQGSPTQPLPGEKSGHDLIGKLMKHWGNLAETIETVRTSDDAAPRKALRQTLPIPDHTLGAKILHFISALRTGDVTSWLRPETIAALEKAGKGKLLEEIKKEFGTARQLLTNENQGWQTLLFPVFDGEELYQTRMYVRDHEGNTSDGETNQGTRFVIEVDLESLGEMQFDGLVYKGRTGNARHFDLIIRTHEELSYDVQEDITGIFVAAGEITGMKGGLLFQVTRDFPVQPEKELPEKGAGEDYILA